MQHARIVSLVVVGVLAAQPACLFHLKRHERTQEERDAESKREAEQRELAAIAKAEIVANPVVTGALADAPTKHEPYSAWFASYKDNTLCVQFRLQRKDYSDRPKEINVGHFRLIAPDAIRVPRNETSITAVNAALVNFDAYRLETSYAGRSDGSVVQRDLFQLDETYEACFEQVSRVLSASSEYAQVQFFDPQHGTFRSSWRLSR